jgi:putative membrane protein
MIGYGGIMMSKRILYMTLFLLLAAGTAYPQERNQSAERLAQLTKSLAGTNRNDAPSQTSRSRLKVASEDKNFATKAAEAGMAEVDLGQLAVRKAGSEEVRQFARRMVEDHNKANAELMQLAQSKEISLPAPHSLGSVDPTNDAATTATGQHISGAVGQQKAGAVEQANSTGAAAAKRDSGKAGKTASGHNKPLDKLAKLSGADFDREYMKLQVADHDKAVALFEKQSKSGKDAELKAFAARTLPTLKEHQQMARQIHARINGKADNSARAAKKDRQ